MSAGRPAVIALAAVLLAAMLAGAAWVAVPVWLKLRFGVLEVISTLLLNFVAESLVSLMVQGPLQESQHIYPQSDPIADAARLPLSPGDAAARGLRAGAAGGRGPVVCVRAGRCGASGFARPGQARAPPRSAAASTRAGWRPSPCSARARSRAWPAGSR